MNHRALHLDFSARSPTVLAVAVVLALFLTLAPHLRAQSTGPGMALQLNGATQYVSIATTGSLSGTFTIEMWARPDVATADVGLAGSRTPADFSFDCKFMSGNLIHGDIGDGMSWLTTAADASVLYSTNRWCHVAYVVTPTNYTIYVGAAPVAAGSYGPNTPVLYDADHQLVLGWSGIPGIEYFSGEIDEVRVWSTARSQAEIGYNYYRRLTGAEPGLMGYWRFDEGAGATSVDASGHGFTATLVNGPAWVGSTAPIGTGAGAPLSDSAAYTFSTFAGFAGAGAADGLGPAAQFNSPFGVAVDGAGDCYVADTDNHTIRKITPAGVSTTIAGFPGLRGTSDGTGGAARFAYPAGVAVDGLGNLYVADTLNDTIRMISPVGTNWVVTTIAGLPGSSGSNDGTNSVARFNQPDGVAVDTNGNVFVADTMNSTIRKITAVGSNWVTMTVAGNAHAQFPGGNDGTNTSAQFQMPHYLTIDGSGNLYVADTQNYTIRKVTPSGTNWVVTTIAGALGASGSIDDTNFAARFAFPIGIAVNNAGTLYVGDTDNNTIRKIARSGTNWVVTTLAGNSGAHGYADGTGTNALFYGPFGVAVDVQGNLRVADYVNNAIRKVTSAGIVQTLAGVPGSAGSNDGSGITARFNAPLSVAVDENGTVYVADTSNNVIREITSAGLVSTLAGLAGAAGTNDGVGSDARFNRPSGIALDVADNIYVSDYANSTIRKITQAGVVSTLAGLGGVAGTNDGNAVVARFNDPQGLAVDFGGNVLVADSGNNVIRRILIPASKGPIHLLPSVTTIAGVAGFFNQGSSDGTNSDARFRAPGGVALDSAGTIYVTDSFNDTVRKIVQSGTNWVVSTIAGSVQSFGARDGTNGAAQFDYPVGIATDNAGNLYVGDQLNSTIRMIAPSGTNWITRTIGGLYIFDNPGSEDGAGSDARFDYPAGVAVDNAGEVYVADSKNNTVRLGVFSEHVAASVPSATSPPANAQLTVTLLPPEAQGQWRFPWELGWRNSGVPATNLTAGNYPIVFRNIPGYLPIPASLTNFPVPAGSTVYLTNYYYPTLSAADTNSSSGTLTVNIGPNPPGLAAWHFLGDSTYYPPGYTTNLLPGTYLIGFRPVSGYSSPSSISVDVSPEQPAVVSVNYLLALAPPSQAIFPAPVPPAEIADIADYPFGFDGQLQSDVGYGSGVAVETNVVLTAAHMVFDDSTLAYVQNVYWYLDQENGLYQPQPLTARGWYVLSGYAAQRTNDLGFGYGVDQSSAQSRNLDVAAVYFLSPAAGGGYGGYLPSDNDPNPWLTGNGLKMLVGYPVDGSSFGDATIVPGVMYQTQPQPFPMNLSSDPVTDQQVYTAPWFLSYPGNSGGPLYVQFNGYYYPAGVYLGTLYNGSTFLSAVRGIDSNVVSLITLAQTLGDNGTNNTGGGVITIIPNSSVNASHPGYMQWRLGPPAALQAGAGWRLSGDTAYSNATNYTRALLSTNAVTVQFKPIPGWNLPPNQSVSVSADQITPYTAFYSVISPALAADAERGIGITGTTNTSYRIESRRSLASGSWLALSTNTIVTNGFNPLLPPPRTNQPSMFYRAVWLP